MIDAFKKRVTIFNKTTYYNDILIYNESVRQLLIKEFGENNYLNISKSITLL